MTAAPLLTEPEKILILLHGSIGDVTRALPLADLLRRRFAQATLAWSVEPAALPLIELCRAVDEIIVFDRPRGLTAFRSFLATIRARRFDLVLDLQRHFKSGFISRWSGAPIRLGFHPANAKEFNWLFNNRYIPRTRQDTQKIVSYMKFAEYLGIDPTPITWNLQLTSSDHAAAEKILGAVRTDIGVLFIGSRWQSKQWFGAQIAAAADQIHQRHGLDIVFLGSSADKAVADEAAALTQTRVINLVGRTRLREAVAIIARARFCLGPDTGLMHIAAALGIPVISLWGATDPNRTGPYGFDDLVVRGKADCSPCYRKNCSIGRICMQSIDTAAIAAMIDKALERCGATENLSQEGRVSVS
jgi:lipopolysaccharide heptosyltransferase II